MYTLQYNDYLNSKVLFFTFYVIVLIQLDKIVLRRHMNIFQLNKL